jgi:hypothetical protein
MMEELHTDSIDGGHEASYGARSRARERAYSNNKNSEKVKYYNFLIKTYVKSPEINRCEYCSKFNKKYVTVNYLFPSLFCVN